jgi:hypothetical protein
MMPEPARRVRSLALRFRLGSAVLAGLLVATGPAVERAVLPLLATALRFIDPDHRIEHLVLHDTAAGRVVELTVTRQRYVFVGGRALEPNPMLTATASTLAGSVRLTLVLVLAGAFAFPISGWLARAVQFLLAGVATLLALALDVPMLLAAATHSLYLNAFDPLSWTPLQAWSDFMLGGGRQIVPLALGGSAALLSQWAAAQAPVPQAARGC